MIRNKIAPYATNIIYGGILISSPLWFPFGLFITKASLDLNPDAKIPYLGSLTTLSATPFAILFTLGYQRQYGFNKKVALLPLLPIAGFYLSLKGFERKR